MLQKNRAQLTTRKRLATIRLRLVYSFQSEAFLPEPVVPNTQGQR